MAGPISGGPNLRIEAVSCRSAGQLGQWIASWRIQNLERQPAEVLAVWLPHDKFTSERRNFDPPLHLSGMGTLALELPVTCQEPPDDRVHSSLNTVRIRCFLRISDRGLYNVREGVEHSPLVVLRGAC